MGRSSSARRQLNHTDTFFVRLANMRGIIGHLRENDLPRKLLDSAATRQQLDGVNAVEQSEWSHVVMVFICGRVAVQELERDPAEVALLGEVPADGALLVIIKCIDGLNLQDLQTMRRGNLVLRVNGKLLDSRVRFSNSTYKC